jgi:asparagine synthase (glutamine-hydrolysing)
MCGIAGSLRLDGVRPDPSRVARMAARLAHRGPDDHGLVELGPLALAHRRLSIIDVSTASHQPMASADGRLWISYNGEVYDYRERREELEREGHVFHTRGDTEVVLAAYQRWGLEAFARLNGMWALAIWDVERRALVLSRDRLGVKPLFLARAPGLVEFASEVKALLEVEPARRALDVGTLATFVERPSHVYGRRTFHAGVERVDPATTLTIQLDGRVEAHRYWRFTPRASRELPARSLGEAAEAVRAALVDSIKLRYRSDVPVGTCLSGGLDSSSIVALSDHALGERPRTYSVVYDDPAYAEGAFVDEMIRRFALEARVVRPDGRDLEDVLPRITEAQDQPTAGPGLYSQWHVMKLAAPEVRVLLDGQGGDELFAGYYAYHLARARTLLDDGLRGDVRALWALVRDEAIVRRETGQSPLVHLGDAALRKLARQLPAPLRARVVDPLLGGTFGGALRGGRHAAPPRPLAGPDLRAAAAPLAARWPTPRLTGDALVDAQWDQLTRTSIPSLLHYEDHDSMAFSIEAREPFLDWRLVELAFSLPNALRLDGATTKRVLREAVRGLVPDAIVARRDKKGFPTPFSTWIRGHARPYLDALLRPSTARARRWLDGAAIDALLDAHHAGAADHGARLWQLATLELFLERVGG